MSSRPAPSWPAILIAGLCVVLAADVALIAADVLARRGVLSHWRWLVTRDRSYAEYLQYTKAIVAAATLALMAVRRRSPSALAWSALLAFVALDDSLQWHERAGHALASVLRLPALRAAQPNDVGELAFYASVAVMGLAGLAIGWLRGGQDDRRLTRALLGSFAALAVCAVGLDALSSFVGGVIGGALAVVEESAELLALTVLLFAVLRASRYGVRRRTPLHVTTTVLHHSVASPAELPRRSSRLHS